VLDRPYPFTCNRKGHVKVRHDWLLNSLENLETGLSESRHWWPSGNAAQELTKVIFRFFTID